MLDGEAHISLVGKTAKDHIEPTVVRRGNTHWYRFDPNRPTFDQLRAIEADNRRRIFQTRKRRINDTIKGCFQKLLKLRVLWRGSS